MPDDRLPFVAINVVNSSTMNKSEKRPSTFIFKKSTFFRQPTWQSLNFFGWALKNRLKMQKQYQVLFYFQQKKNTSIWNKTPAFASWEQKWKFSETGACSEFQSFKIVRKKNFLSSKQSFLEKFSSRNFFSNSCFAKISAGNKNKLVFKICFQSLSALSSFLLKT